MSYRLVAQKLVDRLFNTIDNREYYDVILYGLEIAISTLVNMILVITLAILFGIPMETFIFCLFFMPLRVTAGGLHAKSHMLCIGLFLLCQNGSILLSKQVSDTKLQILLIISLLVISVGLCIRYAAINKKTSEETMKKHRRISLFIVCIYLLFITIGILLGGSWLGYALIGAMAMFCESISLLPIGAEAHTEQNNTQKE